VAKRVLNKYEIERYREAACELWVLCRKPANTAVWGRAAEERFNTLNTPGIIKGARTELNSKAGEGKRGKISPLKQTLQKIESYDAFLAMMEDEDALAELDRNTQTN